MQVSNPTQKIFKPYLSPRRAAFRTPLCTSSQYSIDSNLQSASATNACHQIHIHLQEFLELFQHFRHFQQCLQIFLHLVLLSMNSTQCTLIGNFLGRYIRPNDTYKQNGFLTNFYKSFLRQKNTSQMIKFVVIILLSIQIRDKLFQRYSTSFRPRSRPRDSGKCRSRLHSNNNNEANTFQTETSTDPIYFEVNMCHPTIMANVLTPTSWFYSLYSYTPERPKDMTILQD